MTDELDGTRSRGTCANGERMQPPCYVIAEGSASRRVKRDSKRTDGPYFDADKNHASRTQLLEHAEHRGTEIHA